MTCSNVTLSWAFSVPGGHMCTLSAPAASSTSERSESLQTEASPLASSATYTRVRRSDGRSFMAAATRFSVASAYAARLCPRCSRLYSRPIVRKQVAISFMLPPWAVDTFMPRLVRVCSMGKWSCMLMER